MEHSTKDLRVNEKNAEDNTFRLNSSETNEL